MIRVGTRPRRVGGGRARDGSGGWVEDGPRGEARATAYDV
jgi:hypothetical protein